MELLKTIASGITTVATFLGGLFGLNQTVNVSLEQADRSGVEERVGAFNPTSGGTYQLQASITPTATSVQLVSFKEPISNFPYTMAYLNSDIAYGVIQPANPSRSEIISFTGITQNSDGSAVLTGVTRGLSKSYPYTASSTFRMPHPAQAEFVLSDVPQLFNQYANKSNNESITGLYTFASTSIPQLDGYASSSNLQFATARWSDNSFVSLSTTTTQTIAGSKIFNASTTFNSNLTVIGTSTFVATPVSSATPTAPTQLTNKAYVDSLVVAGAPDASETAKGIVEEATAAETIAGTATGGTGARLFVNPNKLTAWATSTFRVIYATTSSSANLDTGVVSLDAGDIVTIHATAQRNSGCASGQATANILLFNGSATTTLSSTSGTTNSDLRPCSAAAIGHYLVPSSQNIRVTGTYDADGERRLLVYIFRQ